MTELDLYKFCQDKELDWRGDKLMLWIDFYYLKSFTEMVGSDYFSEGDIEVGLLNSYIAIELNGICEYFDIEPENILKKS